MLFPLVLRARQPDAVSRRAPRRGRWARAAHRSRHGPRAVVGRAVRIALSLVALLILGATFIANTARAQVDLQQPDSRNPIGITAVRANHWSEGVYDVWWFTGGCTIAQGAFHSRSDEAIVWIERGELASLAPQKLITYLEGHVTIDNDPAAAGPQAFPSGFPPNGPPNSGPNNIPNNPPTDNAPIRVQPAAAPPSHLSDDHWLGNLLTISAPKINAPTVAAEPAGKPPIYNHALANRFPAAAPAGEIQQTQFTEFGAPQTTAAPPIGSRRLRAFPRTDVPVQIQWFRSPSGTEWTGVVTSGINLIVDGLKDVGSIDVSADRLVIWTSGADEPNLGGHLQAENTPLEVYLEGNVVFRQGNRIVQSPAMYFDVRSHIGLAFNAELLTPLPTPQYPGLIRLRANVLRQLDDDHFVAQDSSLTTSRMGDPTYEMRSREATMTDTQRPLTNLFTGTPVIDPRTGEPVVEHEVHVTGSSNLLYLENVPVFYWPYFATDLDQGDLLIRDVEFKRDGVFGYQLLTEFNAYQLLGIRSPPKGTTWYTDLDYLSLRGPAAASNFHYDRDHFFDIPGHTYGLFDAFIINDSGLDNLGLDRRAVEPSPTPGTALRGRLFAQHREQLPDDWTITGELGYQSDRNFLEEYFQKEFDQQKDESTDLEIRRNFNNQSLTLFASSRASTTSSPRPSGIRGSITTGSASRCWETR